MKKWTKYLLATLGGMGVLGAITAIARYESGFDVDYEVEEEDVPEPDEHEKKRAVPPEEKLAANRFIDQLMTYKGAQYKWGGATSKEEGLDCSGTPYRAASDLGVQIPRTSKNQALAVELISEEDAKNTAGAFVFYAKDKNIETAAEGTTANSEERKKAVSTVFHVAISLGDGTILEAQVKKGVTIAKWGWWQKKYGSLYGLLPHIEQISS